MGRLFLRSCFVLVVVLSATNVFAQDLDKADQDKKPVVEVKVESAPVKSDKGEDEKPQADLAVQAIVSEKDSSKPEQDSKKPAVVNEGGSSTKDDSADKKPDLVEPAKKSAVQEPDPEQAASDQQKLCADATDKCDCDRLQIQDMDLSLQSVFANQMVRKDWVGNVSCNQLTELKDVIYLRHGYFFDNEAKRTQFQKQYSVYVPNANVHEGTIDLMLTSSDRFSLLRMAIARRTCN